jgi:hypothetical protein
MERDFPMKINGWILAVITVIIGTASQSLGADYSGLGLPESFSQLEKSLQGAREAATQAASGSRWPEIEAFHSALWRAMALDPSVIAPVPVNEVPKNLFSGYLNEDLEKRLAELQKSERPKELGIEAEFSQYVVTAQNIINLRKTRQFPQARAVAKRGTLDAKFLPIERKLGLDLSDDPNAPMNPWDEVDEGMKHIREHLGTKDPIKKDVFSNQGFVWYLAVAYLGFMIGVIGIRIHPNFFQRFVDTVDFSGTSATTHSAGSQKLDYARWLREFEEILSRLKSTQLSHERRIEDLVTSSDKMSHQLFSLASDARIKNEASLEYRMSTVVKGMQRQLELGHKLQGGDRVQINIMLEHCLRLCDAIEAGAIHFDRTRVLELAQSQQSQGQPQADAKSA